MIRACSFCDDRIDPRDEVVARAYWRVIMNRNQNYLGKTMLVLKRHETEVTALTPAEQSEFWQLLSDVRRALEIFFQPDQLNYAFLMNQDAHVHLHVIPRYKAAREFAGLHFTDAHFGEHYQLTQNVVPLQVREQLALELRALIPKVALPTQD